MRVAILSDSHGRVDVVKRALALLAPLSPDVYIHCGDVGGEAVFDAFIGLPFHFVWGNTDEPSHGLRTYVTSIGFTCPRGPLRLTLGGKEFAVFHGHEIEFADELDEPHADYVLHGHTHETADRRVGRARVINPGALYRARIKTVATLDLPTDTLQFHVVEPHG
jgi:putative phosphoesterase